MYSVRKETTSMYTRDGLRLDADIYSPESAEKFPVLLMRQPYGRAIASTVVYAHPMWYASQGYTVVIQDVRGRGTSQGEFRLFEHEIEDGLDTLNWVSELFGSKTKVGMYGFSYQGMTQLYTAIHQHPALKTICPSMIAYDLYTDWAYENDAFCLQANLGWAIQLAAETSRLKGDEIAFQKLYKASRNLPLSELIPAYPNILKELALDSFYHDWLTRSSSDEYWKKLSPKYLIQELDIPMLHIGGWFDPYLRGTINLYQEMAQQSHYRQQLIIAPWTHIPWGQKIGAINYGKNAISSIDQLQINWFDHFLKEKDDQLLEQAPVLLFEMGSHQWINLNGLPKTPTKTYYLSSKGLASIREDDGKLTEINLPNTTIEDIIVHDPWRPFPALGGHTMYPGGAFERSHLDSRSDILKYTTEPLKADLQILGQIVVDCYCIADTPSFDLCAILSEVYPDGKIYNFTQGYIRINSNYRTLPIKIPLQFTCIKIFKNHCIRLSLSGACFPAYPVNTGTGKSPDEERLIEAKIITLKISSQGGKPSQVILPLNLS
ncbi:S15 family X-Pro dipeptidyl-peptidase [Aphanothece hegewaldii CCALA 016]|uniref:S15 family X-Pro dipeptidyl-peptidase n=1 Tax=Aphanothece hegewaldii CCALA 016 TaxID=2107694 RepID=A0A2T1M214_9CHRO|nr:CocE/NonD family hydrolase [Aphanothece hegewaldii]PSF38747.1 S15 family X-Pro dipeptidyl-peptidase [Aphanothece hegewaldii CCALA 016]